MAVTPFAAENGIDMDRTRELIRNHGDNREPLSREALRLNAH